MSIAPQCIVLYVLFLAVLALHTPLLPPRALLWAMLGTLMPAGLLLTGRLRRGPGMPARLRGSVRGGAALPRTARVAAAVLLTVVVVCVTLLPATRWQAALLPDLCERVPLELRGVVRGLPLMLGQDQPGGPLYRFDLTVRQLSPAHCRGPQRIRLYYRPGPDPEMTAPRAAAGTSESWITGPPGPGTSIAFGARLRRPWGLVNPYALEGERRFLLAGVHAVGSVSAGGIRLLPGAPAPGAGLDRLRTDISTWLRGRHGDEIGGLLAALAVGDRRFIAPEGWDRLRLFGLTHAFVISGLHITLSALPGWWLGRLLLRLRLLCRGRPARVPWPPLLALGLAGGYACLAGLSLPTQRALLLLLLGLLPLWTRRPLDRGRLLAACALLLWLLDPVSLLGASFWLSLGAVALLLWFSLWLDGRRGLVAMARVQGLMLVGMLPLGLYWFDAASTAGGALNLVAIPLLTLLVVPLLLLAVVVAPLSATMAALPLDIAAEAVAVLWFAMEFWAPALEPSAMLTGGPALLDVVLALLATLLLAGAPFPGRFILAALLTAPLLAGGVSDHRQLLRVTVFDVGQGTAALLQQGGESLLYDTGGGPPGGTPVATRSVLPLLRGAGINRLDHLVLSHADRDHDAGEDAVRAAAAPQRIWRSRAEPGSEDCRMGREIALGDAVTLRFLSPALPGDSDNNASCVLLVRAYGQQLLLPGDIEQRRERDLAAYWGASLQSAVLLAGHHGSATSSSRTWLRTVDPAIVIVTAGRSNAFGHPSPRVLDRFAQRRLSVLNTAFDGALELRLGPRGQISCRRLRHRWQPFWRHGLHASDCMQPPGR